MRERRIVRSSASTRSQQRVRSRLQQFAATALVATVIVFAGAGLAYGAALGGQDVPSTKAALIAVPLIASVAAPAGIAVAGGFAAPAGIAAPVCTSANAVAGISDWAGGRPVRPALGRQGCVVRLGAPASTTSATLRVAPGFTFNLIAALVRLRRAYDPRFALLIRTSSNGLKWSAWQPVSFDASDGTGVKVLPDNTCSEPIWVGSARYLEYRVTAASHSAAALRFTFINSMGAGAGTGTAGTGTASAVGAMAAVRFADSTPVPVPTEPPIVTRSEWGANESWCSGDPGVASLAMAFLHHTDTSNDYTEAQAPAIVRAIYYYHTQVLGWDDIGYNFLIDKYGTIYEGRAGSITANVTGAQVLGFNTHSLGVALIGDYMNVAPTAAQLASLEKLLAWKFEINGIDPLSTAVMTCATTQKFKAGQQVTLPTIAGHRDANYTDCPGTDAYELLPQIRTAVAAIERPDLLSLTASAAAFDPTGNATQSNVTITGTLAAPATWTITVRDGSQRVVATFSGSGTQLAAIWNGRTSTGAVLPDGNYTVTATATNVGITALPRNVSIAVVTVPPQIASFSPRLGLIGDSFTICGANFIGTTAVSVDGVLATRFTVTSATLITVTVPVGASGTGPIAVTTPAGSVRSVASFTVMAKPVVTLKLGGLTAGDITFGQSVIVSGTLAPPSLTRSAVTGIVQREQYGKWLAVTSFMRVTSTNGAYSASYRPVRFGMYRVKMTVTASTTHAAATTMWQTFTVK